MAWHRVPECLPSLRNRVDEAKEIEQISRDTLPMLEEIRDHLDDQPRVNRAIMRIDALRARMNGLGACYDLITQLTQSTELKRFEADRKISATRQLDATEKQRRQVGRDIENVRSIADAAAQFRDLMRQVIDQLAEQSPLATREAA
jgi:hypothetical protein